MTLPQLIFVLSGLWFVAAIALRIIVRLENKRHLKAINHDHHQAVNATVLQPLDIPTNMEEEDVAVLFSERVFVDCYKSCN